MRHPASGPFGLVVCVLLVLLFFIKNIFGFIDIFMTEYLEQKVLYSVRRDVYGHLQNLPVTFFERENRSPYRSNYVCGAKLQNLKSTASAFDHVSCRSRS